MERQSKRNTERIGGLPVFGKRTARRAARRFGVCALLFCMFLTGCQGKKAENSDSGKKAQKDEKTAELEKLSINQVVDLTGYVKLGKYKGIEIQKIEPEQVTEQQVEKKINNELESHASRREKKDKTIEKGDYITLSFQGYRGKKKIDQACCENLTAQIGSGTLIADLEKGLIGKRPGREFKIAARVPEEDGSAYAGKKLLYHVTVSDVFLQDVPKLTDDTAEKYFDCDTAAEVRESIRGELEEDRKQEAEDQMAEEAWGKAVKNATVSEYPKKQLEEFKQQLQTAYEQEALQANLSIEDYMKAAYGIEAEEYDGKLTEAAKDMLASEMVYQAVIKAEDLTLTKEEYEEGVKTFVDGENYKSVKEVEEKTPKTRLEQRILYRKAYRLVYENALTRP